MQIDNSKRSSFVSCPRKYFLRYKQHLTSVYGSSALRYGSTWHALMEGYYGSIAKDGYGQHNATAAFMLAQKTWEEESQNKNFMEDYRTLENCFESFILYLDRFHSDSNEMKYTATERLFKIKLSLSEEEKKLFPCLVSKDLFFTGKLDLECSISGQKWIQEFKTTGQSIQLQAERLFRSPQLIGYAWAAKQINSEVMGVLTSIHQLTSRKKKDGTWGTLTREFLRHPNIFSEADMEQWRLSYLATCNVIAACEESNFFPCHFDSCYQFGRCGFIPLCEQNRPFENLNLDGYAKEEWNVLTSGQPETPIIEL